MTSRRLTLTVPQPCQQSWADMTPHSQGRYCPSCQKTVVDFTSMTDADVVEWFAKQKGETCGRFKENQLNRELVAISLPQRKWAWRAALLGITAWLSSTSAEAQSMKTGKVTQPQPTAPSVSPLKIPAKGQSSIYKGVVLDSASLQPMPGVTVHLSGTSISILTGVQGEFQLAIPDSAGRNPSLQISFIGYLTETLPLKELDSRNRSAIRLRPDRAQLSQVVVMAGAVAIVKNPPVQQNKKLPTFFQRLKEKLF
ncbi:carboxypeptidase-like regulatory domain-containing protein [Rufibacter ruber]|uniref:carboxypeptidase-like regulatory domain-containing protein n=1 Tax=Rufibacter ruber TaxID=1783499 RepID=UPI0009ECE229|nr:carboxypeptidase-like regulatory domain-containing protein [Rufibacter ruber]